MGQFGAHIGGRRGHQQQIGFFSQGHVFHLPGEIAVKCIDARPVPGELFENHGAHHFGGVFRHEHVHVGPLFFQRRTQRRGFIDGNTAGYPQQHTFLFEHKKKPPFKSGRKLILVYHNSPGA